MPPSCPALQQGGPGGCRTGLAQPLLLPLLQRQESMGGLPFPPCMLIVSDRYHHGALFLGSDTSDATFDILRSTIW
jgi:hypothetical protein